MTVLHRLVPFLLLGFLALAACDSTSDATGNPMDDASDDPPAEETECEAALTARVDGEVYCPFMVSARLSEQNGTEVLTLMSLTRSTVPDQLNIQVESPAVGAYPFDAFAAEGTAFGQFFDGVRDFDAIDGTLTIDVLTADRVAGTFAFSALFDTGTEEERTITDGVFDISITP